MDTNIFDKDESYLKRFIKNQGKRFDFPSFKYLDAKFHPKFKDHIVVLSENKFPEDSKFTYGWDAGFNKISELLYNYETDFMDAINQVKSKIKDKVKEEEVKEPSPDETVGKEITKLDITNQDESNERLISKNIDEEFEGGEGDEEKSKSQSFEDDEESNEEMEKEMDQIVNDSKEDGGVETHEQLLDEIEKEFGDNKSIASENKSKKSPSRPSTAVKAKKDDESKSVKSGKLFEEEKNDNGKPGNLTKTKTLNDDFSKKATKAETKDIDEKSLPVNHMEETKENDSRNSSKLNTNRSNDQLIDNLANEELNDIIPIEPIIDNDKNLIQEPAVAPESTNIEQPPLIDSNPPIEQISDPIVEPQKEEKKLTANEEFDLLTEEQKEEVIDIVSNVFINRGKDSFMYLSMQKEFLGEGFEIPDNLKLNTESFTYSSDNYYSYNYKVNHKKFEYQPVFLKHQYQISLWKFDEFGASKIKFKYFTPQHERIKDSSFRGFEIKNSHDNENILIQEKCNYSDDKMLI